MVAYCRTIGNEARGMVRADDMEGVRVPEGNALATQVGGDHYKKYKIQPVEYIHANGIEFMPGCAIKYLSRYKDKGGADDVRKALHFCKLILELEYGEKA